MARQIYDAKIRVNFDRVNVDNEPIASGELLEVIIAKLIAKMLAINREYEGLIKIPDYSGEKAGRVLRYIGNTSPYIAWTDEGHKSITVDKNIGTSTVSPGWGGKVGFVNNITRDEYGHVTDFSVGILELPELPENLGGTVEELTKAEIDSACDYLPVDDSGIKPITDEQIDKICVG